MIHSSHRFHGRSSLRLVYQRGQTVRGPLVSLRYIQNNKQPRYRVAVVVSRKVSKSAVVRNRVRRRLYEVVRTHAEQITAPHDLVITVYGEEVATISHANLKKIILGLMEKAGVLSARPVSGAKHGIVEHKETSS